MKNKSVHLQFARKLQDTSFENYLFYSISSHLDLQLTLLEVCFVLQPYSVIFSWQHSRTWEDAICKRLNNPSANSRRALYFPELSFHTFSSSPQKISVPGTISRLSKFTISDVNSIAWKTESTGSVIIASSPFITEVPASSISSNPNFRNFLYTILASPIQKIVIDETWTILLDLSRFNAFGQIILDLASLHL